MKSISELREEAFLIMNNLACIKSISNGKSILYVIDLSNKENTASFIYMKRDNMFLMLNSTFSEGKRKYEMLYYLERNKEYIVEVLQNA